MTRFVSLERQRSALRPETWELSGHPGARAVQLTAHGEPVRVLSRRPAQLPPGSRWLGPRYEGRAARVEAVELTGGSAIRITYGPLVVWNYTTVVPPAVLQLRGTPAKIFQIPGGIVHASFAGGVGVVADASFADGNSAVLSLQGDKIDTIRAVQLLRRAQ